MMVLGALGMAVFTACQTTKTPQLTGGNRASGVVELTYEYDWPNNPAVNFEPGRAAARERCVVWGYLPAELFMGFTTQCLRKNKDDACLRRRVTVSYQCTRPPKP